MAEAGWYRDPANRFQMRYFDGALWTRHVSNNGVAGEDPVPPGQPADWQWTFCSRCGAIGRYDDDHCWRCVSSFPEWRTFGAPPSPAHGVPPIKQFEAAANAMVDSHRAAVMAREQGRYRDALRGFDEALWHRHFAEQFRMQLPKGGTAAGIGVSLLTMGLGPTDLIVGPLVRRFVNKRTQAKRERTSASERVIIQLHALDVFMRAPSLLDAPGGEHDALVRLAFTYMPPGNNVTVDQAMSDEQLRGVIISQLMRVEAENPAINQLLCEFVVYFQWVGLGAHLAQLGYPLGHLLTGERPRRQTSDGSDGHGGTSGSDRAAGHTAGGRGAASSAERSNALRVLGLSDGAGPDEVKHAYREMTKRFHPDMHADASPDVQELVAERMRAIIDAYELLKES